MATPRVTHTYVILEISSPAYEEIRKALKQAGYDHAFHFSDGVEQIDMGGLAIQRAPQHAMAPRQEPHE